VVHHFINQGDAAGLGPSPYFDTPFYKKRYPDWAKGGALTAFEDFIARSELGESRQPHPLIDPDFYARTYPDIRAYEAGPAHHFMRFGDLENRRPSEQFDADFYRSCYMPLHAIQPLRHYLVSGQKAGLLPRPMAKGSSNGRDDHLLGLVKACTRPLIIAVHDAQRGGVPILALDLAREARGAGWEVVFLLGRAGPLLPQFRALGHTAILAEGWSTACLTKTLLGGVPVVALSAETAPLAAQLAEGGLHVALFLHEPAQYTIDRGLIAPMQRAQRAGAHLVASFATVAEGLAADLGSLPVLTPETPLPVPGLAAARTAAAAVAGRHPVLIGAGNGGHRKGFDRFLSAAAKIVAKAPNAAFVWLGDLDGWAQDLADTARNAGIRLLLPGFVPDAAAWYRCADAYLLTSRHDPGPATAVHALCMGVPVVGYSGDIGIAELIADFTTFVDPEAEDAYVSAALDSSRLPPAERRRRRIAARQRVGSMASYFGKVIALTQCGPTQGDKVQINRA
jgi:glycosyltransferase involved in cell wall biosynthesis